jgi:type III secretion protein F
VPLETAAIMQGGRMDLTMIINKLEQLTRESAETIKTAMEALNSESGLNDPQQTLKTQFMLNQYSNFINYQTSMVKIIRDLISGIISKL